MNEQKPQAQALPPTHPGVEFSRLAPNITYIHFTHYYQGDAAATNAQARYYLSQVERALLTNTLPPENFIIDGTAVHDVFFLPTEARKCYMQAYGLPGVGHVAMVGMNQWLKGMIVLFAQVTGRSPQTAFFKTKDEALAWLKQQTASHS